MKKFFDCCADTWDDSCDGACMEKIRAIVTMAGVHAGSRVIDIACGTGVLFSEMLTRDPEKILGVDLSDRMIAHAGKKFSDSRLELVASDVFQVKETGFDVAMIYSAYPHFPDRRMLAEHVSSLLKPGGRFMVAHSEGRDAINGHHMGKQVSQLSWTLRPVWEEAKEFSSCFSIDILVDTDDIYIFSGVKTRI